MYRKIYSHANSIRVMMMMMMMMTDKLYFCTSLAPSNVIPSDSIALLLLQ